jgi:hypothetical protein
MMGGLVIATILTLIFLPALYATWFRVRPASNAPHPNPLPASRGEGARSAASGG